VCSLFSGGVRFRVRRAKRSVNPVTEKKKKECTYKVPSLLWYPKVFSLSLLLAADPYRIHVEAGGVGVGGTRTQRDSRIKKKKEEEDG
jgi:hypothetical protein